MRRAPLTIARYREALNWVIRDIGDLPLSTLNVAHVLSLRRKMDQRSCREARVAAILNVADVPQVLPRGPEGGGTRSAPDSCPSDPAAGCPVPDERGGGSVPRGDHPTRGALGPGATGPAPVPSPGGGAPWDGRPHLGDPCARPARRGCRKNGGQDHREREEAAGALLHRSGFGVAWALCGSPAGRRRPSFRHSRQPAAPVDSAPPGGRPLAGEATPRATRPSRRAGCSSGLRAAQPRSTGSRGM